VRNQLSLAIVVVYDGVSAIDAAELRVLLEADRQGSAAGSNAYARTEQSVDMAGSRRFGSLHVLQENMHRAHRRITSFS